MDPFILKVEGIRALQGFRVPGWISSKSKFIATVSYFFTRAIFTWPNVRVKRQASPSHSWGNCRDGILCCQDYWEPTPSLKIQLILCCIPQKRWLSENYHFFEQVKNKLDWMVFVLSFRLPWCILSSRNCSNSSLWVTVVQFRKWHLNAS